MWLTRFTSIESQNDQDWKRPLISSVQPFTYHPTKPCPSVQYLNASWTPTSKDSDLTTSLGSPFQHLTILLDEKYFPMANLNLPWRSLMSFPPVLSLLHKRRRRPPPHHNLPSDSYECSKISPEPPLLHSEQLPQLLPIRPVLQTPHSFAVLLWIHSSTSMSL